ncbi:MAG TPA: proline iminopeptidase-family hydrolase [Dongiaceae bacterium]|nr:proline iminopeptidase-family hydrolase [Dongiaceae bacterium]
MSGISVMTDLATYPAPDSSGFVDVPGGRVWYRSNGDRHQDRLPLLIVHGGPGMQHDYLLPLTALAEERRVILYDQLDCGRSDRPGDSANWTFERYLAEIEYLRLALGLERCHLFGNSWGGSLAAVYAGAGSSGLASLILAGPLIETDRWLADNAAYCRAMPEPHRSLLLGEAKLDDADYLAAVDAFYRRHLCRFDPWPEIVQHTLDNANMAVYQAMWGPAEFTSTGTLRHFNATSLLERIAVPTLFICGEYDESTPDACADFASFVPQAEVAVIAGASHLAPVEQPDAYIARLRAFLDPIG